jgi:hypothetical protein
MTLFKVIAQADALKVVAPNLSDNKFTVESYASPVVLNAGSSEISTIDDGIFNYVTNATIRNDVQIITSPNTNTIESFEYQSLTPSIATVSENGYLTCISDGIAQTVISAKIVGGNSFVRLPCSFTVSTTVSQSHYTPVRYVDGSLGKYLNDGVDALLVNKNPVTDMYIFSVESDPVYLRNTSNWLYNVTGMTCLSPWNNTEPSLPNRRGGSLISPRHFMMAKHFPPAIGATIKWISKTNTVYSRTITDYINVIPNDESIDILVGVVDEDLPEDIGFLKVLPKNWQNYWKSYGSVSVPVFCSDQEHKNIVGDAVFKIDGNYKKILRNAPTDAQRLSFFEMLWSGDSGQPWGVILDGELILAGCSFGGEGGTSPIHVAYHDEINAAMTTLGGGYQLTDVDLSDFPTY